MDEETSFTADDNGTNEVNRTDDNTSYEDDESSDNESWSPYDILPSEDFSNNEHGADSENVSEVYLILVFNWQSTICVIICLCF